MGPTGASNMAAARPGRAERVNVPWSYPPPPPEAGPGSRALRGACAVRSVWFPNIGLSIFGNMFCVTALILLMSFHLLRLYGSLLCDMLLAQGS